MAVNEPTINGAVNTNSPLSRIKEIKLIRWRGGQHPTFETITRQMQDEGLRPYASFNTPNSRTGARSHGYTKVIYCVEGQVELQLPDVNQSIILRPGDRIEVPRGVRHATICGEKGARIIESPLVERTVHPN